MAHGRNARPEKEDVAKVGEHNDNQRDDANKAMFKDAYDNDKSDNSHKPHKNFETSTKEERLSAKEKVDKSENPSLSDADRRLVKQVSHCVLEGHPKELAHSLNQLKDDPQHLKQIVREVNHGLSKNYADVKLGVEKDGSVVAYKDFPLNRADQIAVRMDLKTGESEVHRYEFDQKGNRVLDNDKLHGSLGNPYKMMASLGDHAIKTINNDGLFIMSEGVNDNRREANEKHDKKVGHFASNDKHRLDHDTLEIPPLNFHAA